MRVQEIGSDFSNFLGVVEKRFIKEDRWDRSYDYHADPIFFCSVTFLKMLLQTGQRYDGPNKALVWSEQEDITAKKKFDHGILKRKFPNCIDTPVIGYYPPTGFVGWHTNYKAHGYIILFNWSENGEGFFRFVEGNRMTTLKDGRGWSCKVGYFGENISDQLWHCARTECRRFSFSYRFEKKEDWEKAIDIIQA